MRTTSYTFYQSEIMEMAKENAVKDHEMEDFLEFFDQPNEWIHLVIEKFKDDKAKDEAERRIA